MLTLHPPNSAPERLKSCDNTFATLQTSVDYNMNGPASLHEQCVKVLPGMLLPFSKCDDTAIDSPDE